MDQQYFRLVLYSHCSPEDGLQSQALSLDCITWRDGWGVRQTWTDFQKRRAPNGESSPENPASICASMTHVAVATGRWRVSAERPTLYSEDVPQWRERPFRRQEEGQQQEPIQSQGALNCTEQWQGNPQDTSIKAIPGGVAVNTAANFSSHYRQLAARISESRPGCKACQLWG